MSSADRGVVRVLAPAKVNPALAVLARREDGFHELDMTMLAVDLCDVVEARAVAAGAEPVSLELGGEAASADVPTGPGNLAVRAALAVVEEARARGADPSRGVALRLEKRVPSRAGLGGGSSDAAAAAVAARAALGSDLPDAVLLARLAELGSDCAFFLAAGNSGYARCRGRGERVEALPSPAPGWSLAVVVPGIECPTGAVYGALEFPLSASGGVPTVRTDLFERSVDDARRALFNHLESAALRAVPELEAWRRLLDREGAEHFRLSGSGSAFFGLFRDGSEARRVTERVRTAAVEAGLEVRGSWTLAPAGFGAKLVERA